MPIVGDLDRYISMALRKPTNNHLAWHRKAVTMPDPDRGIPNEPHCGWFKRKFVTGGPWVPARIWLYQWTDEAGELLDDEALQCEVNGQWADPIDQWSHLCGNPITEAEWNYLEELRRWTAAHAPDDPMNTPRQKIDLMKAPIPFGGKTR